MLTEKAVKTLQVWLSVFSPQHRRSYIEVTVTLGRYTLRTFLFYFLSMPHLLSLSFYVFLFFLLPFFRFYLGLLFA